MSIVHVPLSEGKISGTGTLELVAGRTNISGVLISTDGTNAAVVMLRETDSSGTIILDVSTKTPLWIPGVFRCDATDIYYSISGTGASAMLFSGNVAS